MLNYYYRSARNSRSSRATTSSSLTAPHHNDTRRWSVASLPSSSGYGTPGSAGSGMSVRREQS